MSKNQLLIDIIKNEFKLYFQDLTRDAQARLCESFNVTPDEENWGALPITTIIRDKR